LRALGITHPFGAEVGKPRVLYSVLDAPEKGQTNSKPEALEELHSPSIPESEILFCWSLELENHSSKLLVQI